MQLIFATAASTATVPPVYGSERNDPTRRAASSTMLDESNNFQIVKDENIFRAMTDSKLTGADAPAWVRQLRDALSTSLERRHVEAGYDHPDEDTVRRALEEHGDEAPVVLTNMVLSEGGCRGDVLRLIGRLPYETTGDWGMTLAAFALNDPDVDVRDAAISALEQWGGPRAAEILAANRDPELWLREYAHRVAAELNA